MAAIPQATLSDQLRARLGGRRVLAGVLTTFTFEPGFFELEVLPLLFDQSFSQVARIKQWQLEDALRDVADGVAVFYDAGGLSPSEIAPRLDVAYIPMRHATGVFHPKLVLALVEGSEGNGSGAPSRSLVLLVLSANLTRAGWWENVEVAHIEEIAEGARSTVAGDLLAFLDRLATRSRDHIHGSTALDAIRTFLRRKIVLAKQFRRDGRLLPRFYAGGHQGAESLTAFLTTADGELGRMHLEVIAPYLDTPGDHTTVTDLRASIDPRSVTVYLPRDRDGVATVTAETYADLADANIEWGQLPEGFESTGKGATRRERVVHAKVYRFWRSRPKRELIFIGSVNATRAGAGGRANIECGVLIEPEVPYGGPWLRSLSKAPSQFTDHQPNEDEESDDHVVPLSLRFDWTDRLASARWDAAGTPGELWIEGPAASRIRIPTLPVREWEPLSPADSRTIEQWLDSTTLVRAGDSVGWCTILIQETGVLARPSLFERLTAAEILYYWSLLTQDQRREFLERHLGPLVAADGAVALPQRLAPSGDTAFDRFAGIFHAFSAAERHIFESLDQGNRREAEWRVFGEKWDSLGTLLRRAQEEAANDPVVAYLTLLCGRQLAARIEARHRRWWQIHEPEVRRLTAHLDACAEVRAKLVASSPDLHEFLDWLEPEFLEHRGKPTP